MNETKSSSNRPLIVASTILLLIISSLFILKFIPFKPENHHYTEFYRLGPQADETKKLTVKIGHYVSGSYSVSSDNPAELIIFDSFSILGRPQNILLSQKRISGTFQFTAKADQYYVMLKNPASSGFFGFGEGPDIDVSLSITTSGWTTWI